MILINLSLFPDQPKTKQRNFHRKAPHNNAIIHLFSHDLDNIIT